MFVVNWHCTVGVLCWYVIEERAEKVSLEINQIIHSVTVEFKRQYVVGKVKASITCPSGVSPQELDCV